MSELDEIPAGDFARWVARLRDGESAESDVPCDGCTACCTSSQFIHVAPDESDTLAHIPTALLFEAPGLPKGYVVMGYDAQGHCPMLVDGACSIYEHRPRTCRDYDCRVFAATATEPDSPRQQLIADRARRWRFDHADEAALAAHRGAEDAAAYLTDNADRFPEGLIPRNPTQLAVVATRIHNEFLDPPVLDDIITAVRLQQRRS